MKAKRTTNCGRLSDRERSVMECGVHCLRTVSSRHCPVSRTSEGSNHVHAKRTRTRTRQWGSCLWGRYRTTRTSTVLVTSEYSYSCS
eukprot:scaffold321147_cov15-Prasinocladus_malaysianus.AAC.1